jgi:hypothetical protein
MISPLQRAMLSVVASVLTPLARLMLRCGVGYSEFESVSKSVFVQVAAGDYGIRGRPTNVSRIAAMTGLSRKEIGRIRRDFQAEKWTPDMEISPANCLIHYWQFDPDFSISTGVPRTLQFDGRNSFTTLVRRYAGDIPVGALKRALLSAGTVLQGEGGQLTLRERYYCEEDLHEDFVRNIGFALTNLANTAVSNALIVGGASAAGTIGERKRLFERSAWTEHLSPESLDAFRQWVSSEGSTFIERADSWLGANELPRSDWDSVPPGLIGVGVYFFRAESSESET